MEMKLRFDRKLKNLPNQEQAQEIANSVMSEPDMGWEYEMVGSERISERHKAYMVELKGEHATYTYKVNISWGIITILEIKDR